MEEEYKKEWVVQRIKGNKLKLFRVPLSSNFPTSYSLFRITYTQFRILLNSGKWKLLDTDEYFSSCLTLKENSVLKNIFIDIAKQNIKEEDRQEVYKKIESSVRGTSCLIRTSTKSSIQIAYRMGNNKTQINRVCIPDYKREEFFEDCRRTNDPTSTKYYKIRSGYTCFEYWNKYMDDEYKRQVNQK